MTFLPTPPPERIYAVSGVTSERLMFTGHLFVGLKIIDKDRMGLPAVPHPRIVFAMGDENNPEREVLDVPLDMARNLAARIIEFCDAGEKMPNA